MEIGQYISESLHESGCQEHKLLSMRTSAKTGENVSRAFETLVQTVHNHFKTLDDENDYGMSVVIGNGAAPAEQASDKCC